MAHRRFVILSACFLVLFLLVEVAVSVCLDNYGVFGTPAFTKQLDHKSADYLRMSKPYMAKHLGATTFVTGSSIANIGIDPAYQGWRREHRPVFNFGIDGAAPDLQADLLSTLSTTPLDKEPRFIVMLTSFEDAVPYLPGYEAEQQKISDNEFITRLSSVIGNIRNPSWSLILTDLAFSTVSMKTLYGNLNIISTINYYMSDYLLPDGFEVRRHLDSETAEHGSAWEIDRKHINMAPRLLWWMHASKWPVQTFTKSVTVGRQAGADVAIVLAPTYVEQEELHQQLGLRPSIRQWRTNLTSAVSHINDDDQSGVHVTLFDCQSYPPVTNELLADETGSLKALTYFWDTAHFRPLLGQMIMDRVEQGQGPAGFCEPLTPGNEASRWRDSQIALEEWERARPTRVAAIASIIADARRDLCKLHPETCGQ